MSFSGVLSGFKLDEHIFEPVGYSCNALKGGKYFTIHVTPQKISPYVSFETNIISERQRVISSVLKIFQPKSFDLIDFKPRKRVYYDISDYQIINNVSQKIDCGYHVGFASYYQPPSAPKDALSLHLDSIEEKL